MYLKHLELQGYKSFARKTEFVFEPGITAIVGPNGSGKSNIADAVRWVLGETRMSRLRAKVTEDLIFAGSGGRARLGMAQVSMTLDNSDGRLPIDYSEVTITRRAYRDGQNEYLLNGTQVRLRDITDLLGAGGLTRDAYVVIGQGLVDAALSLGPEERRTLIDVAAGIRPMQDKRDRALAQLDETQTNLTRVRDIIAELEPRLRRLERQAERARQSAAVARELEAALRTWYGYQWHQGQQALRDARARAHAAQATTTRLREELARIEKRLASRRDREEAQAEIVAGLRERRAEVRGRYEALRRDLAVLRERARGLRRRRDELEHETADLQARRGVIRRQIADTEASMARLSETCEALAAEIETLKARLSKAQQREVEVRFALEGAQQRVIEFSTRLSETHRRILVLTQRLDEARREQQSQTDAIAGLAARIDRQQVLLAAAQTQAVDLVQQIETLRSDCDRTQAALATTIAQRDGVQDDLDGAQRQLEALRARHQALEEMRAAGVGYASGVQAVLQARDEIGGIVGTVAALIQVPPELETAIEAVLGPYLQAVVVEREADALQAIAWLRTHNAGRATFIPLDTLESTGQPQERTGIVGIASKVVSCAPRYQPIIEKLLGHAFIVQELKAAQQLAASGSPLVATLDGTVFRPGGVAGGTSDAGVLSHERAWRELPAQIAQAEAWVENLVAEQRRVQETCEGLRHRVTDLQTQLRQAQQAHAMTQHTIDDAQWEIEALQREVNWRQDLVGQRAEEIEAIAAQIGGLEAELRRTEDICARAQGRVDGLQSQLDALGTQAVQQQLSDTERHLARSERDRAGRCARWESQGVILASLEHQIEGKQAHLDDLTTDIDTLEAQVETLVHDEATLASELENLEAELMPAEDSVRAMRRQGRDLEEAAALARDRLRAAEAAVSETTLEAQRREDRLRSLQEKIADDLKLVAVREDVPHQLMLELDGRTEVLPAVAQIPEGLERRIRDLRRQMRQLGVASPEIVAEYEETKQRYDFLTTQAADLEEAALDLRRVVAELNTAMTRRFQTTFREVAAAFEMYFERLFGGGQARLSLLEPEETGGEPGLEIMARPPGKRSQNLALLSGGERALTAVALLFALLRVSPTPFCVLDEVDAMLDEVNIGRFRATLEEVRHPDGGPQDIQFIIITHNRGTIEAADTIFGISMGQEGVSRAISLRLDGVMPAVG